MVQSIISKNDGSFLTKKLTVSGAPGESGEPAQPHVGEVPRGGQEQRRCRHQMEGLNAKGLLGLPKTAIKMHAWVSSFLSHHNEKVNYVSTL